MDGVVHAGSQHTLASLAGCSGLAQPPEGESTIQPLLHGIGGRGGGGQFRPCMAAAKMVLEGDLGCGNPTVHHRELQC